MTLPYLRSNVENLQDSARLPVAVLRKNIMRGQRRLGLRGVDPTKDVLGRRGAKAVYGGCHLTWGSCRGVAAACRGGSPSRRCEDSLTYLIYSSNLR